MNKVIDGKILDLLPLTEGQQAPPVIALQAHTCARCARSRRVGIWVLSQLILYSNFALENLTSRNAKHCGASLSDERLTI